MKPVLRGSARTLLYSAVIALLVIHPGVGQEQPTRTQKSPTVSETILVENDDVRVTRVVIPKGATQIPDQLRCKRVIVYITPTHTERHAKAETGTLNKSEDKGEIIHRPAGSAIFRTASKHSITNVSDHRQVSVIVELKHNCEDAK